MAEEEKKKNKNKSIIVYGTTEEEEESVSKLDTLLAMTKALQKQVKEQNKMIQELQSENKLIIDNTTKMGKHIDFINSAYEKLTHSYLFRNIFS
jgi:hypothetical protein